MGRVMDIFDSTYFWLSSKFKDDHHLIGSRQLILLSISETLYLIEPILLIMYFFIPDEIRDTIKPYGRASSLILFFLLIYLNRKRYLRMLENGEKVTRLYNQSIYYLVLFLPLIIILTLFYRPWLPPPQYDNFCYLLKCLTNLKLFGINVAAYINEIWC